MPETPLPYGAKPQSDFEAQYRRVLEGAECATQAELAAVLEIRQGGITEAMRRKNIPAAWKLTLLKKKRINPDWILRGSGAKYLIPDGCY